MNQYRRDEEPNKSMKDNSIPAIWKVAQMSFYFFDQGDRSTKMFETENCHPFDKEKQPQSGVMSCIEHGSGGR